MGKILTQFLYEGSENGAANILDYAAGDGGDMGQVRGKASQFAIQFSTADYFAGNLSLDKNGLPTNIRMNGVSSENLIKEFAEEGLKVVGVATFGTSIVSGSPGRTTFYFEGDPATLQQKFDALLEKSVSEMNSEKNLTGFEQKLIAGVRDALTHNTEKAANEWSDGSELSEGERKKIHNLVSALSKPEINYTGSFSEKDLSTLSASTGIDPAILQAASKAK